MGVERGRTMSYVMNWMEVGEKEGMSEYLGLVYKALGVDIES
jgi:hypothetical protein